MKKIICAFLITTTLLSFTACTGNSSNNTEATTAGQNSSVSEATEPEEAEEIENRVYVDDVAGKTFAELTDKGYKYAGYERDADNNYYITVVKNNADDIITNTVSKLEGKTIKDLYDNDLYVGCFDITDEDCTFSTTIGNVAFEFEIDGALDIVKKYNADNDYFEVEEVKELHKMLLVMLNLKRLCIQ